MNLYITEFSGVASDGGRRDMQAPAWAPIATQVVPIEDEWTSSEPFKPTTRLVRLLAFEPCTISDAARRVAMVLSPGVAEHFAVAGGSISVIASAED